MKRVRKFVRVNDKTIKEQQPKCMFGVWEVPENVRVVDCGMCNGGDPEYTDDVDSRKGRGAMS